MARNKNRMAGDALEESDAGQVVAEDLSAKEEGFRNALERNIGTEEYDRIGAKGHDDPTDRGEYSAREVISEFRNAKKGGFSGVDDGDNSVVDYFKGLQADGATFNNRAKDYLSKYGFEFDGNKPDPVTEPDPTEDVDTPTIPAPTPPDDENDPWPFPPATGPGMPSPFGSQIQQVSQDNDVNTTITGDGNIVTTNQDNSVSQSSGGQRYLADWLSKHDFFN